MVYRAPPGEDAAPPQVILFSLTPTFRVFGAAAEMAVERLDSDTPAMTAPVVRGAADMAQTEHRLAPGGCYRASAVEARVTFAVDALVEAQGDPLIRQIVVFNP